MMPQSSLVEEGLHKVKIGVVALFGIIVPGVWFWIATIFYLHYLFGIQNINSVRVIVHSIYVSTGPYLSWILGFIIVYVAGSVLRILPPDTPDSWSLRKVKERDVEARIEWPDRFPYKSLPQYLRTRGLHGLARLVPWDIGQKDNKKDEKDVTGQRSKTFIHFIKLYIALNHPQMANHLAQQEAFIRLLSGVFYAVVLSTLVLIIGGIARHSWNQLAVVAISIQIFNTLIVYGILQAFHYQRLRELVMILSAYFLIGPSDKSPYDDGDISRYAVGSASDIKNTK